MNIEDDPLRLGSVQRTADKLCGQRSQGEEDLRRISLIRLLAPPTGLLPLAPVERPPAVMCEGEHEDGIA